MMMRWLPSFRDDSSGSAAVEMALMLPLLLMLMFGAFEGGHYLWSEHKVVKGVRDGARYAARTSFSNFDGCPTVLGEAAIKNLIRTGYLNGDNPSISGTDNPVVLGWTSTNVTVTCAYVSGQSGLYGTRAGIAPIVTVTSTVSYPSLFRMFGLGAAGVNLKATATSAVMGL
jgi:hypothetical protein